MGERRTESGDDDEIEFRFSSSAQIFRIKQRMTGPPPAYSTAPSTAHSNTLNVPLTAEQIEQREREQAEADDTDTDSDTDDERSTPRIPLEQRRSIVAEATDLPAGWIREWDPAYVQIPPCASCDDTPSDRD